MTSTKETRLPRGQSHRALRQRHWQATLPLSCRFISHPATIARNVGPAVLINLCFGIEKCDRGAAPPPGAPLRDTCGAVRCLSNRCIARGSWRTVRRGWKYPPLLPGEYQGANHRQRHTNGIWVQFWPPRQTWPPVGFGGSGWPRSADPQMNTVITSVVSVIAAPVSPNL